MRKLLRRFKTKGGMFLGITILTSLVLTISYASFIFITDGYKASNMLISNLMYGITIEEEGSTSTITDNKVVMPGSTKGYFYITLSSVNPIDSKYTLAYKSNNTLTVQYSDRTNWSTQGVIKGYDESVYSKRIKVVIDNTMNTSSTEVYFNVFGGYTYNTYASIALENGYYVVSGPYNETILGTNRLVDVIEKETDCTTETSNICVYGGETISNYLQYPEDTDKSKNLWRITGSYNIDGQVLAKVISITNNTTTTSTITNDLSSFYNTLDEPSKYIESTNKFNCSSTGCTTSSFTNIGLLTKYEYDLIGGDSSYLYNYSPFFVLNNGNIENLNSTETTSYLRGTSYLKTDTKVTGSGTIEDPYVLSKGEDINLVAYTLNGETTDKTYNWLLQNKAVDSVTCENGTTATWNYETNSVDLFDIVIPDNCTIDFNDGYTVTLTATNGTITSATSVATGYNGTVSFNITPNDGYKLEGSKISCAGSATGTTTTTGVQISNIKETQTCTVTLKSILPTLYEKILADNPTVSTRTDFSVTNKSNTTGTIYTTTATEDGSTVYYYSGNTTNNWVQFGGFYWRIIRTNEDGSVRMLYAGQTLSAKPMHIGGSMFNDIDGTPLEAGYMYGTSGSLANNRTNTNSSTIKQTIDTWYENNLLTNYDKYISKTAIYCNDRSIGSGTYSTSSSFYYGVYTRLVTNKTPTYKCGGNTSGGLFESTQSIEDKFSASTSGGGNGQLTYPIALITADEVIFAGGKYNTGLSSPYAWYISNATGTTDTTSGNWWVLSPGYWDSTAICLKMGKIASNGSLSFSCAGSGYVARPVLSLKSCVIYSSGDGTTSSPYQISIDDSCSNAVN